MSKNELPVLSPLEIRQAKFATVMRGFERAEVTAFLQQAADACEQALRENERLRQEMARLESTLQQAREVESGIRTMLVSAQKVADDMRASAQQDAERVVRDAESRAAAMAEQAQADLEDVQRDIDGLTAKKLEAEANLQAIIASLRNALAFVRGEDQRETEPALSVTPVRS